MSEDTLMNESNELEALKARADKIGLTYHPSIGAEKLRERINQFMEEQDTKEAQDAPTESTPKATKSAAKKAAAVRRNDKDRAMELVRIRVTCMNPAKKDWDGEIFTAGNSKVGSVTKYVPFNATDGWHVPRIIYNMMKNRKCQVFQSKRIMRSGVSHEVKQGKLIREFAIEVLPQLTQKELDDLAKVQAMRGRHDD